MKVAIRDQDYVSTFNIKDDMAKAAMSNDAVKQALLNQINNKYNTSYAPSDTEIIDLTGKHLCKYCGEVVDCEYEDLLCEDCRMIFGHALYSEL